MTRGIPGLIAFPAEHMFWRGDAVEEFNPQTFMTVFALCANAPAILSHDQLFEILWGEPEDGGPLAPRGIVRTHLSRARDALARLGVRIHPEWSVGYSAQDLLAEGVGAPKPVLKHVPYSITYHLKPSLRPHHEGRNECDSRLGKTTQLLGAAQ